MGKVVYAKELITNIRKFKKTILPLSEYYVGMEDACEVIIDMINAAAFDEDKKDDLAEVIEAARIMKEGETE